MSEDILAIATDNEAQQEALLQGGEEDGPCAVEGKGVRSQVDVRGHTDPSFFRPLPRTMHLDLNLPSTRFFPLIYFLEPQVGDAIPK